jgi:TolB-like protein
MTIMASLNPGYEYDIFISYRQKDNKHDSWVSEFVSQLKGEIESAFKEDVSIYFDENPHDGLLETHIVDKSLESKLKCLILIPIISQTYCDSKSFAWQHEFCVFNELAKADMFGRDIKLANGNVASRILPIKIHDLDPEDKTLLENELGGALRSIEFIYKEAGVNRPLKLNDDPKDNLNKTNYINQINKVANAVKEIITALKKQIQYSEEVLKHDFEIKPGVHKKLQTKIIAGILILLGLIVIGYFFIPKLLKPSVQLEKSIAVLPFLNDSPSDSTTYFINGVMDEILNNLQKIGDFRVLSRTSVEQYRGSTKSSIPKIAKELDVNYIVEGSGQKYGNTFRLRVQLIEAHNDKHLWAKSYEQEIRDTKDIFRLQSQIAQSIASELETSIKPEEKQLIEKLTTSNLTALYFYQKGMTELAKLEYPTSRKVNQETNKNNTKILLAAKKQFDKSLEYDSTFALAYAQIAKAFRFRSANVNLDTVLFLSNRALSYDGQCDEAFVSRGLYYYSLDMEKAMGEFDKALKINPNMWEAYYWKGYGIENEDLVESISNYQKAATLNHDSQYSDLLFALSNKYITAGFPEKAKRINMEIAQLDGDSIRYFTNSSIIEWVAGNYKNAYDLAKKAYDLDSTNVWTLRHLGIYSMIDGKLKESLRYFKKLLPNNTGMELSHLAYINLINGYKNDADIYLKRLMENCKERLAINKPLTAFDHFGTYYNLASIYAMRGDKEKAYENLRLFNKASIIQSRMVALLKTDPWFDIYRSDPDFKKILSEIESNYMAEHERVRKWLDQNKML